MQEKYNNMKVRNTNLYQLVGVNLSCASRKLAPLFQPIRCKTKTNHELVTRVFPRLEQFGWFYFEFWLAVMITLVLDLRHSIEKPSSYDKPSIIIFSYILTGYLGCIMMKEWDFQFYLARVWFRFATLCFISKNTSIYNEEPLGVSKMLSVVHERGFANFFLFTFQLLFNLFKFPVMAEVLVCYRLVYPKLKEKMRVWRACWNKKMKR